MSVIPPAPSVHATFDDLRRRVDRLREPSPLESRGPAWHEAALRHIDLSASLLDLTETLIDVKLKLQARDTERGRRISDRMTKTLGVPTVSQIVALTRTATANKCTGGIGSNFQNSRKCSANVA